MRKTVCAVGLACAAASELRPVMMVASTARP
jgi:hypothetical protein